MKDEILTLAGIQFQAGTQNCGGSRAFYEKLLLEYLEVDGYQRAICALSDGDRCTVFREVHTMKGLTATLGMEALSKRTAEVCRQLREHCTDDRLPDTLRALAAENDTICKAIREATEPSMGGKSGQSAG